ncbi:MAG: SDR family oxidoreductase [Bryobacterales bacterium]|nr:SDR family oxidoreductase [Bryobacterales bacterium]
MSHEFQGKTALVTGASRGIGAATAIALAQAGCARILVHYGSYKAGAEEVAAAVRAAGAEAIVLPGELATEDGIQTFLTTLAPFATSIDILVNNAGSLLQRAKLAETTFDLYNRVMDLNAKSTWFIAQAVASHMTTRGGGVIVNLSSIAARNGGGPGATLYASSKAAVACMTKGMAKELAPFGVRVNAISPGTVDNDFHAKFSTREILDNVVKLTPQGRLSSNEDMAAVVVFLCSDSAANIIGQTIEINGGMWMV